jgi:hypothetical protein
VLRVCILSDRVDPPYGFLDRVRDYLLLPGKPRGPRPGLLVVRASSATPPDQDQAASAIDASSPADVSSDPPGSEPVRSRITSKLASICATKLSKTMAQKNVNEEVSPSSEYMSTPGALEASCIQGTALGDEPNPRLWGSYLVLPPLQRCKHCKRQSERGHETAKNHCRAADVRGAKVVASV